MGKIGNFEYPAHKISDMIELAKIIEEEFKGQVKNQNALGAKLGHKNIRSGGYVGKITALKRYGLITGRGELETTQLAKQILHPISEEEKTEAIAQAMENVELFRKIFERLGEDAPSNDFWVDLVEITGEDRNVAQKDASKLRNLYMDGYRYLTSARKAEIKPKAKSIPPTAIDTPKVTADTLFELRTRDYGTLFAKDEKTIAVARNLIKVIEEEFKARKKSGNSQD